jgi:dihydrofolate reductase
MDASVIKPDDLIYYTAVSLDGFVAGKEGDVKWLEGCFILNLGFHDFIKRVGGLVKGRRTYDKLASFGKWPYGTLKARLQLAGTWMDLSARLRRPKAKQPAS